MSSSPTVVPGRHLLSFKIPQTEKASRPRLWVMAAAYGELPWSLLNAALPQKMRRRFRCILQRGYKAIGPWGPGSHSGKPEESIRKKERPQEELA